MQAAQTTEKPLTFIKSKADSPQGADTQVDASGTWTLAQIEALFAVPFTE